MYKYHFGGQKFEYCYFVESGIKRRAEHWLCENCGQPFLRRLRGTQSYCSPECKKQAAKLCREVKCSVCEAVVDRPPSKTQSKSGLVFCGRDCKEYAQTLGSGFDATKPSHYGRGVRCIGQLKRRKQGDQRLARGCECGDKRPYVLTIHHINGDRSNNEESNLEVVCGTCHMLRHLKIVDGAWVYAVTFLTPRERLAELSGS
jgi:hypothetical protein